MPGYGQMQRTPAEQKSADAAERQTSSRDHAPPADALGAALNENPRSQSLMQLRAALDESLRVQALQGLGRALNDDGGPGRGADALGASAHNEGHTSLQKKQAAQIGIGENRGLSLVDQGVIQRIDLNLRITETDDFDDTWDPGPLPPLTIESDIIDDQNLRQLVEQVITNEVLAGHWGSGAYDIDYGPYWFDVEFNGMTGRAWVRAWGGPAPP
jgi:hypothetical protein